MIRFTDLSIKSCLSLISLRLIIRSVVVVVVGVALVFCVSLGFKAWAKLEITSAVTDARHEAKNEHHEAVVRLLAPHIGVISADRDVDTLRLYAESSIKVPQDANRHLGVAAAVYRRIAELDVTDVVVVRRLVRLLHDSGEVKDAIRFAKRSIEMSPHRSDWKLELGWLLLADGQAKTAIDIADGVLQNMPTDHDALNLRIDAMVAIGATDVEAFLFIDKVCDRQNDPTLQNETRLMYAQASGNEEVVSILQEFLEGTEAKDATHARWLVSNLQSRQTTSNAIASLRRMGSPNETLLPVLHRYLQDCRFDKIDAELEGHQERTQGDAKLLVIKFLARWMSTKTALPEIALQLNNLDSHYARTWLPVLKSLADSQVSGRLMIERADSALAVFPGSPWLHFIKARALNAIGESDLAISSYRIAIRANPQWSPPRIELAELLKSNGDFRRAFGEVSIAIRANPEFARAFEVAMISAVQLINQSQTLSADAQTAILNTIEQLRVSAEDQSTLTLLNAVSAKLKGDRDGVDSLVSDQLASAVNSAETLELLSLLAESTELRELVLQKREQQLGWSNERLLKAALAIANTNGESAALEWVSDQTLGGDPISRIKATCVSAEILSRTSPEAAVSEWMKLSMENRKNADLLVSVLRHPAMARAIESRRQLIELLKQATGDQSVRWQLEDIRLKLDEDKSDKQSAAAVLRLNNLLKQAPSSRQGYALMFVAFERLNRPDKQILVIRAAFDSGVRSSGFHLKLAELLVNAGQTEEAVEHATVAAAVKNPLTQLRVANIFLAAEQLAKAEGMLVMMSANLHSTQTSSGVRRRLVGAWKRLAMQSGSIEHWQEARLQLLQLPSSETTTEDSLILAGLHEYCEDLEAAAALYSTVIASNSKDYVRAVACNNLAIIRQTQGQFAKAATLAEQAIELHKDAEFIDTLNTIIAHQKADETSQDATSDPR